MQPLADKQRVRVHVALWSLVLSTVPGCGFGDSQGAGPECFGIDDCGSKEVCFYGRCVSPGYGISTVYAELNPPNDSPWLTQQYPGPLDLDAGKQEILLENTVAVGVVVRDNQGPLAGVLQARPARQSIPGRELVRQAGASEGGFDLRVLQGNHTLTFQPASEAGQQRPALRYPDILLEAGKDDVSLTYPSVEELVPIHGVLRADHDVATPVEGALVKGTANDASGQPLSSTTAETGANGSFYLLFPPGVVTVTLTVQPGSNPVVPVTEFGPFVPDENGGVGELVLGVTEKLSVTVIIEDDEGRAVPDASVLFEGAVGEADGVFNSVATTDVDGSLRSELLPGEYQVTVVPPLSQTYAMTLRDATVSAPGQTLRFEVRRKVSVEGIVASYEGRPVMGAEVTYALRNAPVSRVFTATTGERGTFSLQVDPGRQDLGMVLHQAEYEVTVRPPAGSGLPYFRELVRMTAEGQNHVIQLYEPELVYGIVRDPDGNPVSDVLIGFYSADLGSVDAPALIGIVQTKEGARAGEFVLPLPIPDAN